MSSITNPVGPTSIGSQSAFDGRLLTLGIELDNGVNTFNDLYISAKGTKFGNGIPDECECLVYNLTEAQQNYLLTQTSPFNQNRTAKLMTIDAGRQIYGASRIYQGDIIAAGPTQPPDIGIILRGLTGAFLLGDMISVNQPAISKLSTIAQAVANSCGATLNFQATDKQIANYSYSGATLNQINKLGECGVDAWLDGDTLVVKNKGQPLPGANIDVNSSTGMIGIPEINEYGVNVKVFLNPSIKLGSRITIKSVLNPAANGTFTVYKIDFETANRENPFWYNIWASTYIFS